MSPVRHAPAALTAGDGALRAQYLREVLDILYPETSVTVGPPRPRRDRMPNAGPARRRTGVPTQPRPNVIAEYVIVPDARRPRLLVPAGDRRVAAAAVRGYGAPGSRAARLRRNAVAVALRTGASSMLLRDRVAVVRPQQVDAEESTGGGDSIDRYLAEVLDIDVAVSVHIGPARANRKPLLHLLSPAGTTVGFAKLGTRPLTRALVRAETTALATLAHLRLRSLTVPRVLHSGVWRGHEVLVQSALPIWQPRTPVSARRLVTAMREVAGCLGTTTGPLSTHVYWKSLRDRLDRVASTAPVAPDPHADHPDSAGEARTLALGADRLVDGSGHVELTYGAWHGDWAPWNMAATASDLMVWDWERFAPDVPLGFDALHYDLQRLLGRGMEPGPAVELSTARAARLLEPYGVDREAAAVTARIYLVELATRFLEDRQADSGGRLGVLGNWLLPALAAKVATR